MTASKLMKFVDARAEGRGYTMAQMKVTRRDGTVEYHLSKPQIKPWDLLGWLWYAAHSRNLILQRSA